VPAATQVSAKELLMHAVDSVRQALDTWQATDLERVAQAGALLQSAAEHLNTAAVALGRHPADRPAELRALAAALRRDLLRITKVVDACSAFQNGLAVRLGMGVSYLPSGQAQDWRGHAAEGRPYEA